MNEQHGFGPSVPTVPRRSRQRSAPSTGHYAGLHGEDIHTTRTDAFPPDAYGYDDDAGPRTHTSTRRYVGHATPQTVMRVTTHQEPRTQRASRLQQPQQQTRAEASRAVALLASSHAVALREQRPTSRHWLFYAGVMLLLMLFGWMLLNVIGHWWSGVQDDWQYGKPRTLQIDMNVGHGGISHFTVENLQGHIIITEVRIDTPAKAKIYVGPTFSGAESDLAPATLTFADVNGDGLLDMIVTVENVKYTFLNNKDGSFHPLNGGTA